MPETKAQQAERLKAEQNPWHELPRMFQQFRAGYGSIPATDLSHRLRSWGLYTQGDGGGAFGGVARYFMLRIRIPNGLLSAAQAAAIAALSDRYGRGLADITVRQNIQLHWLEAEDLPDIFHALWNAGLTSKSACGDDTRNVTGCPLAGLDPEEWTDASPLALEVGRELISNDAYYNLPRKFKLCVSGCRQWCPNPEINDVSLTAAPRDGQIGFGLRVGGGLSATPLLAVPLPVWLRPEDVVPVARAVCEIFRDAAELRENRAKARLKFLFLQHHWTPERFVAELERRLGRSLPAGEPDTPPPPSFRDHVGIHPQRQPGLFYAGVSVLRGRLRAEQLAAAAAAAARYASPGAGTPIRLTGMQNLILTGIPGERLPAVEQALQSAGLPLAASAFRRGAIACTGTEFCKLAVTETKARAAALVAELERRLPDFPEPIRINLNGCPNSCGQHWIADIGLQGAMVKTPAGSVEGFEVFLGGGLGAGAALGRKTAGRVAAEDLANRLEALLRFYWRRRQPEDTLRAFVRRTPPAELAAVLGQAPAAPAPVRTREELAAMADRSE